MIIDDELHTDLFDLGLLFVPRIVDAKSLSMSMSVASKATRWLGKKYRRSKSMLAA
jgi:hypothetical protein